MGLLSLCEKRAAVPWEAMAAHAVPLQPREGHGSRDAPATPGGAWAEQGDVPWESSEPVRRLCWDRLLAVPEAGAAHAERQ